MSAPSITHTIGVVHGRLPFSPYFLHWLRRKRAIVRVAPAGTLRRASATTRIDATGLVVSPGCIDVHSHSVEEAFKSAKRLNEGVVRVGVTSVVGGPDGYFAPFHMRMVIDSLKHHGAGTNMAMYIGHNGVREAVMGMAQRAPSPDEVSKMKAMVREGME